LKNDASILLAIDSATSTCTVALGHQGRVLSERTLKTDRRHNEALPGLVEEVLVESNQSWNDLSGIVVSIGPGSFTGLRVGVSYAKGAALALDIPILPVSTLSILANSFLRTVAYSGKFTVLIPARRGEAFGQTFQFIDGVVSPEYEPKLIDISQAIALINNGVALVGEGCEQFVSQIKENFPEALLFPEISPSGDSLLTSGFELLERGITFPSICDIEPVYLKEFTVKSAYIIR